MSKEKNITLIVALIFLGISSRFLFLVDGVPSIPNFTAIGAVALFGSYFLRKKSSIVIPLLVLWVSDLVLNNVVYAEYFDSFSFFGDPWVYGGFVATILVGWYLIKKLSVKNVVSASILGALIFFIITNFSVWLTSGLYTKDISGFFTCYIKAIPFFRNALLGNLFFSAVLFGAYSLISRRSLKEASLT